MAQHFLLSTKARTLSLANVLRLSDDEAYDAFKAIRFSENHGEAFCPKCGSVDLYNLPRRKMWRCKAAECGCQFSVTSGTIFASRKLSIRDYPRRDRDLHERREGLLRASTEPRS